MNLLSLTQAESQEGKVDWLVMFPSLCEAGGLSLISSGERFFSFLEKYGLD